MTFVAIVSVTAIVGARAYHGAYGRQSACGGFSIKTAFAGEADCSGGGAAGSGGGASGGGVSLGAGSSGGAKGGGSGGASSPASGAAAASGANGAAASTGGGGGSVASGAGGGGSSGATGTGGTFVGGGGGGGGGGAASASPLAVEAKKSRERLTLAAAALTRASDEARRANIGAELTLRIQSARDSVAKLEKRAAGIGGGAGSANDGKESKDGKVDVPMPEGPPIDANIPDFNAEVSETQKRLAQLKRDLDKTADAVGIVSWIQKALKDVASAIVIDVK